MSVRAVVEISEFCWHPHFSGKFWLFLPLKAAKRSEIAGAESIVRHTHGLIAAYHMVSVTGPTWISLPDDQHKGAERPGVTLHGLGHGIHHHVVQQGLAPGGANVENREALHIDPSGEIGFVVD